MVETAQEKFIREVKFGVTNGTNTAVPFNFSAKEIKYNGSGTLNVDNFYVKDILLLAPHVQFPGVELPCKSPTCRGCLKATGWSETRQIVGFSSTVYLLQFRYSCPTCRASSTSYEYLKSDQCPAIVNPPQTMQWSNYVVPTAQRHNSWLLIPSESGHTESSLLVHKGNHHR